MMKRITAALLLIIGLSIATPAAAEPLRFCFEDGPEAPWTLPDGSGLTLDLLRTAAERVHEEVVLQALPWKRCIAGVSENRIDGAIGSADTPERRRIGHIPMRADGSADIDAALYVDYYYVYLRKGSGVSWDGRQLIVPHNTVLIPRGYNLEADLATLGYKVNESINSGEEGLRMLRAGLAEVAILPTMATLEQAKSLQYRDTVTVAAKPWSLSPGYLLVSNGRYEKDPARIRALWESIRAVRHTAEYSERVRKITGRPPIFAEPPK